jgi:hypothetical protein
MNWEFNIIHLFLIESVSILVIVPMVIKQDPFVPVVGMTSFAIFANFIAVAFVSLAIQARYIGHRVQAALISSYALTRDEKTRKIMSKIHTHQRNIIKGTIAQTLIFTLYGAFPFMWNKHDYLMPISILASALQMKVGLDSLVQEDDKGSHKPSSPLPPNDRKIVARSKEEGSSVVDGSQHKDPYVHGLDMDPLQGYVSSSNPSFVYSSEGDPVPAPPSQQTGGVRVQISPAMRLLRSLTPSRKDKGKFDFEQQPIKEETDDAKQEEIRESHV